MYAGHEYFVLHIVYVKDEANVDRPILYCSSTHSPSDTKFPITSVALYATLTANLPMSELLQSLHIQPPPFIPAVLTMDMSLLREATIDDVKMVSYYSRL